MKDDTYRYLLYRQLGSDKSPEEFFKEIIALLEKSFKGTEWNIGEVVESTARLKFFKNTPPFKDLNKTARSVFLSGGKQIIKKDIPKGFRWVNYQTMVYNNQKLGVVMCMGMGSKKAVPETIGDDLGFILRQYQLKRKLIKDAILMNTIIMSSKITSVFTTIDPLIKILLSQLKSYLYSDEIKFYIWKGDDCFCYNSDGSKIKINFPLGKSIVRNVKENKRSLMIMEAYKHSDFNPEIDGIAGGRKLLNLIASPVKVSDNVVGVLLSTDSNSERVFVGSDLVWVRGICGEIGAAMERLKLYGDMKKLFLSSIESLASAIEGKDPYTHGHSRRVTMFSVVIGRALSLDDKTLENIKLSGLLHDIGKISVPEQILLKKEKLTDDEWYILKQHPEKGVKILEPVEEFKVLLPGIKHHHECWDGGGYPDGLKGKDIPLIARIINVADAFDAMTSKRIYRDAMSEEEGLKEIQRCAGKQFDAEIADAFIKIYKEKFYTK